MVLIWLRDRADLAQTLFPPSASAFRYCRGQCFLLSSKFISRVTQLAKSAYTIFTSVLLYEQRRIMERQCNEKHSSEPVPPLGTPLHPPLHSQCCWRAGRLLLISQLCRGAGDAEEENTLCSGFREKHFNLYVWNYLLGFYFDEVKDLLQFFKLSSCI